MIRNTGWFVLLVALTATGVPHRAAAQAPAGPGEGELKRTFVRLAAEGYVFGGGVVGRDSEGNVGCDGLERIPAKWTGSGFVARSDGTLLTNFHVATKAVRMVARFDTGATFPVNSIRAYDSEVDLAVLRMSANTAFPAVKLGDSDQVRALDPILAVGSPFGVPMNLTQGQVSSIQSDETTGVRTAILHTAVIAPGNSGGPLYKGSKVVGVNVATLGYGLNMAIPINLARPLLAANTAAPLRDVFLPSPESLLERVSVVGSSTGPVPGRTSQGAGKKGVEVALDQLSDYFIFAKGPEGVDLGLIVLANGEPIACGQNIVAISTQNPRNVSIWVMNGTESQVNSALVVGKIVWGGGAP